MYIYKKKRYHLFNSTNLKEILPLYSLIIFEKKKRNLVTKGWSLPFRNRDKKKAYRNGLTPPRNAGAGEEEKLCRRVDRTISRARSIINPRPPLGGEFPVKSELSLNFQPDWGWFIEIIPRRGVQRSTTTKVLGRRLNDFVRGKKKWKFGVGGGKEER